MCIRDSGVNAILIAILNSVLGDMLNGATFVFVTPTIPIIWAMMSYVNEIYTRGSLTRGELRALLLCLNGQRKFMGTLWNTYAFFVLYANIDNFDASKYTLEYDKLPVMDKWLLSKLNSTVAEVDSNLDQYRIPEAAKALQDFVDEMSNWYVRRSRERFWAKGMEQDKINAYMTLYTALTVKPPLKSTSVENSCSSSCLT